MARLDLRTEENIKNIIELREQGKTYKEIAEKFKCNPGVITNILKSKENL